MAKHQEIDHEIFMKQVKKETKEVKKTYEQAKKSYESVLKRFLIRNVTGKKNFTFFHEQAKESAIENIRQAVSFSFVDELMTLDSMVNDYYFWLQDGRYETKSGAPLSKYF